MEKIVEFIYIFIPIFFIIIMIYVMYKEKDIIKFNNLKLPKTEYLKGKYISGLNYKSGNMYLTFDKDILSIGIENNDGIFYDKINDINGIEDINISEEFIRGLPEWDLLPPNQFIKRNGGNEN